MYYDRQCNNNVLYIGRNIFGRTYYFSRREKNKTAARLSSHFRPMLTLASLVRRRRRRHRCCRRPVTSGVLFLVQHRVELLRLVRVDRQQLIDHLSDGRVFPDPRVHVHRVGLYAENGRGINT